MNLVFHKNDVLGLERLFSMKENLLVFHRPQVQLPAHNEAHSTYASSFQELDAFLWLL